jgi:hypothetical protein
VPSCQPKGQLNGMCGACCPNGLRGSHDQPTQLSSNRPCRRSFDDAPTPCVAEAPRCPRGPLINRTVGKMRSPLPMQSSRMRALSEHPASICGKCPNSGSPHPEPRGEPHSARKFLSHAIVVMPPWLARRKLGSSRAALGSAGVVMPVVCGSDPCSSSRHSPMLSPCSHASRCFILCPDKTNGLPVKTSFRVEHPAMRTHHVKLGFHMAGLALAVLGTTVRLMPFWPKALNVREAR